MISSNQNYNFSHFPSLLPLSSSLLFLLFFPFFFPLSFLFCNNSAPLLWKISRKRLSARVSGGYLKLAVDFVHRIWVHPLSHWERFKLLEQFKTYEFIVPWVHCGLYGRSHVESWFLYQRFKIHDFLKISSRTKKVWEICATRAHLAILLSTMGFPSSSVGSTRTMPPHPGNPVPFFRCIVTSPRPVRH